MTSSLIDEIDWDEGGDNGFIPATKENKPPYDEIDISSSAFWKQDFAEQNALFRILREQRPVSWQRPIEEAVIPDPDDPGYWAVTTLAEINEVSRNPEVYISGQGVLFDMLPAIFLTMTQSFLAMDNPQHGKLRRLVSSAFTPRRVKRMEEQIAATAKRIVDEVAGAGRIDFVTDLAKKMPLWTFCEVMGVPKDKWELTGKAAADIVAWADPEVLGDRQPDEVQVEAASILHEIAAEMYSDRLTNPTDDLFTGVVQAEIDGERLDEAQLGAFFVLMSVAATDTTKHTASFAVLAMTEFPEQRTWLTEDFEARIDTAVEEMIRYGAVVGNFRRTAIVETELAGARIMPGDKVVMFYSSGNRDSKAFENPDCMDLSRDPNPHCGFGGGGVHFCLGSNLAKSMLRALFKEILTRIPDFRASNPTFLGNNFMRGITHLDFAFTPEQGSSPQVGAG
ncbi:MAG TPA: cytochrome P450 [Sporichthyaceae bacterium]|nr:cytochrome P450 [Sporichthyaceae bacterium]